MSYDLLNEMIKYIEDNLTEDISYKKLSRIVGVSEYSLQRIFMFLTGISISEYIRKRRLSKAFEELKTTDIKVIDLAMKYNYDSSISFARAFRKNFDMTPTECRNSSKMYKLFPIMKFTDDQKLFKEYSYEIKKIKNQTLYCFEVSDVNHDDFLYKIRKLYQELKENNIYDLLLKDGMYGLYIYENNKNIYYLGSLKKLYNTQKITLEESIYAIFDVGSIKQNQILKAYEFVYSRWIESTNYEILDKPVVEYYQDGNCYLYFPIKDKQK